jgi:hypothetical protein
MFRQSRAAVPLVPVLRVEDSGDECARPATDDSGFELSRLLLKRLEVLAAALQQVRRTSAQGSQCTGGIAMKDFSTVLLIKILRATVDHVQQSPEIDQASPGVKDLKRTLLEQIARLQWNELPQEARNGIQ